MLDAGIYLLDKLSNQKILDKIIKVHVHRNNEWSVTSCPKLCPPGWTNSKPPKTNNTIINPYKSRRLLSFGCTPLCLSPSEENVLFFPPTTTTKSSRHSNHGRKGTKRTENRVLMFFRRTQGPQCRNKFRPSVPFPRKIGLSVSKKTSGRQSKVESLVSIQGTGPSVSFLVNRKDLRNHFRPFPPSSRDPNLLD